MPTTDTTVAAPERDPVNTPYWDGLAQGALRYQHCNACGHHWLPPRSECPNCLQADLRWDKAGGGARLVSWVVYHMAYHPAFAHRLPYAVAVVELDEGVRLISNLVGVGDLGSLKIDQRLRLVIEDESGTAVPRFRPE
jgi:uncharacterized protein